MTAKKSRNSLGRFEESWMLDDMPSAGGPQAKVFLPPKWKRWKFRAYKKRGRLHFFAHGGQLHGEVLRVWGDSIEKVRDKAARKEREIDQHGQLANALTTAQRFEMARCLIVCEPLGLTPIQACEQIAAAHPKGGKARTIIQVVTELITKKRRGNRRDRYVDSLERELLKFAAKYEGRQLHTITTGDIEDELAAHPHWSPNTVHGHVSSWKVLFNYAKKHEYCFKNPCDAVDLPEREDGEPEIFSLRQVREMLAHTLFSDRDPLLPHCRVYVALGVFAGIRPEEIARLDWEQVDLPNATVTILGAKAKTRQRRMVDMAPNLVAWVRPCVRAHGPVLRRDLTKLRSAIRDAMGLDEWPADVLRHSFGSYHFAHHRSEALVKNQMGHSDDGRMFHSHYRKMVSRQEAAAFWKIFPPCDVLPSGNPEWEAMHPPVRMASGHATVRYDDGLEPLRRP